MPLQQGVKPGQWPQGANPLCGSAASAEAPRAGQRSNSSGYPSTRAEHEERGLVAVCCALHGLRALLAD